MPGMNGLGYAVALLVAVFFIGFLAGKMTFWLWVAVIILGTAAVLMLHSCVNPWPKS